MELGKNLRRLLFEKNLSVKVLSRRSSIPSKTLYHWLNGQKPRNIEQVYKLCQVLEVSLEELFGFSLFAQGKTPPLSPEKIFAEVHAGVFEVILRPLKKDEKV